MDFLNWLMPNPENRTQWGPYKSQYDPKNAPFSLNLDWAIPDPSHMTQWGPYKSQYKYDPSNAIQLLPPGQAPQVPETDFTPDQVHRQVEGANQFYTKDSATGFGSNREATEAYLRALPTAPNEPPTSSSILPEVKPSSLGPAATNPFAITFPDTSFPTPPKLQPYESVPLNTDKYKDLPTLELKGGGVAPPKAAVPQRAMPKTYDWTGVNERLEKARPKTTEFTREDMMDMALLGAISGLSGYSGRGGWQGVSQGLSRMVGGAGQGMMGEKMYQRAIKREDTKDMSAYEERRAGHEQNQQGLDLARDDLGKTTEFQNQAAIYDDAWRKTQLAQQNQAMANDIASKNYTAAMQRFAMIQQLAQGDRTYELQIRQMNDALKVGDWERAFQVSQAQATENARQATLATSLYTRTLIAQQGGANNLAAMPDVGFAGMLVPKVVKGEIAFPGLDMNNIMAQSEQAFQEAVKTKVLPPTAVADPKTVAQYREFFMQQIIMTQLMQMMQTNPQLFAQIKQQYGRMPLGGGAQGPNPILPFLAGQ